MANGLINLLTWNTTGLMSSCSYLCDILENAAIDFCGISEHWLFERDLHFLDKIDNNYRSHSVSDSSLHYPSNRRVGKGGVAILWHRKYDSCVTPLCIDDDRILGVQIEMSESSYIYLFQVYLPCSNHSIQTYKEYIDKLSDILSMYSEKGMVIVMGDFNANLSSAHFFKPENYRSRSLSSLIDQNNLTAINALEICCGAKSSFVSYDGSCESLIDHILVPVEKIDLISSVMILDDEALNVSRHRPITCTINIPFTDFSQPSVSSHINWKKADTVSINAYQCTLQTDISLIELENYNYQSNSDIDYAYELVVKGLKYASEKSFRKTEFKKFLKPYWNRELSDLHKNMKTLRRNWITAGRPRDLQNYHYFKYKEAKRLFRKKHRYCVDTRGYQKVLSLT